MLILECSFLALLNSHFHLVEFNVLIDSGGILFLELLKSFLESEFDSLLGLTRLSIGEVNIIFVLGTVHHVLDLDLSEFLDLLDLLLGFHLLLIDCSEGTLLGKLHLGLMCDEFGLINGAGLVVNSPDHGIDALLRRRLFLG